MATTRVTITLPLDIQEGLRAAAKEKFGSEIGYGEIVADMWTKHRTAIRKHRWSQLAVRKFGRSYTLNLTIKEDVLDDIQKWALDADLNRSVAVAIILAVGLDLIEL